MQGDRKDSSPAMIAPPYEMSGIPPPSQMRIEGMLTYYIRVMQYLHLSLPQRRLCCNGTASQGKPGMPAPRRAISGPLSIFRTMLRIAAFLAAALTAGISWAGNLELL